MMWCKVGFEPVVVGHVHEYADGQVEGNGQNDGLKALSQVLVEERVVRAEGREVPEQMGWM